MKYVRNLTLISTLQTTLIYMLQYVVRHSPYLYTLGTIDFAKMTGCLLEHCFIRYRKRGGVWDPMSRNKNLAK